MMEKTARQIEVEEKIAALLYQIRDIVKEYAPDDGYLSLSIMDGNYISFNNRYYENDPRLKGQELDFWRFDNEVDE